MENGTFAPHEQMFHYSQYLKKNLTFQRLPNALVWSKGLKICVQLPSGAKCLIFGLCLHLLSIASL